jgi:hypothetical protein
MGRTTDPLISAARYSKFNTWQTVRDTGNISNKQGYIHDEIVVGARFLVIFMEKNSGSSYQY